MSEFNFKSAICTSREQSERLLALGLKKETADCYLFEYEKGKYKVIVEPWEDLIADEEYYLQYKDICFPAWSLHRLWCLLPRYITIVTHYEYGRKYRAELDLTMDSYQNVCYLEGVDEPCYDMSFFANDAYESICKAIEWLIKEGYFNKEYLV